MLGIYASQFDASLNHVKLDLRLTLVGPASTSSNLIPEHERAIGDDDNLHIVHGNSVSVKQSLEGFPKSEIEEDQSQWCTKSYSGAASVRSCHLTLFPFLPAGDTTNKKLEQALQFAHGNSASKCDLSSTRNHCGYIPYLQLREQVSDIGCRVWRVDNKLFLERGDKVYWKKERGGQRGRQLRRIRRE